MMFVPLRDDQWERLRPYVAGGLKHKRGPRTDNRRFVDALLWMASSNARWQDLPEKFGPYQAVKRRYYRWAENGSLSTLLQAIASDQEFDWVPTNSTIIRAKINSTTTPPQA
jgi:transposase